MGKPNFSEDFKRDAVANRVRKQAAKQNTGRLES